MNYCFFENFTRLNSKIIVYYSPREVKSRMLRIIGKLMPEVESMSLSLLFIAFFTTDGGGYTIFLRSRAQKWQFSLAQREQNCYFAPAAEKKKCSRPYIYVKFPVESKCGIGVQNKEKLGNRKFSVLIIQKKKIFFLFFDSFFKMPCRTIIFS